MKFKSLNLNKDLVSALEKIGFSEATEVQEKTIPLIIKGQDILVRSQTGSGKTFAYLLPLLQNINYDINSVQVLVICPTRELSLQVIDEVNKLSAYLKQLKTVSLYGGSDINRQINALKKKPQIVVGTPGRLIDHLTRRTLKIENLKTLVLDEADEMLNMGFRDDIEKILAKTPQSRQTLMFSATYPSAILEIANNYQKNVTKIEIGQDNKSLESIKQYYVVVSKHNKQNTILELFNKFKPDRTIIFANTKLMAQNLSDFLNRNGHLSQSLHGDLRQSTRTKVIKEVKSGKVQTLVASDVATRGLDISDVDYVINYDLPHNVEYYLHRIGRTARAGKKGNAISIITTKNQLNSLKEYEIQTNSVIKEIKLSDTHVNLASDTNSKRAYGRSARPTTRTNTKNAFGSDSKKPYNSRVKDSYSQNSKSSYNKENSNSKRTYGSDSKKSYSENKLASKNSYSSGSRFSYPSERNKTSNHSSQESFSQNSPSKNVKNSYGKNFASKNNKSFTAKNGNSKNFIAKSNNKSFNKKPIIDSRMKLEDFLFEVERLKKQKRFSRSQAKQENYSAMQKSKIENPKTYNRKLDNSKTSNRKTEKFSSDNAGKRNFKKSYK